MWHLGQTRKNKMRQIYTQITVYYKNNKRKIKGGTKEDFTWFLQKYEQYKLSFQRNEKLNSLRVGKQNLNVQAYNTLRRRR